MKIEEPEELCLGELYDEDKYVVSCFQLENKELEELARISEENWLKEDANGSC